MSWIVSTPQSGSYDITLGASDTVTEKIFGGYFPWNSVGGIVFNDRNDNGIKESWEEGLPNWKIVRTGISTDSTLTDSLGQYNFYPLVLGTYTLTAAMQPTWEQVSPRFGASNSFTFNDYDQHPDNLDFAVHQIPERIKLALLVRDNITPNQQDVLFGQHPGATLNIWGVDPSASSYDYSEGETELPPLSNAFEARLVAPRPSAGPQFGNGSWIDMRGFFNSTQIDTYKVSFRPGIPGLNECSFTLSWSKNEVNASYAGAVTMVDRYNNSTDMKSSDSLMITDATVNYVHIITRSPQIPVENIRGWHMISMAYDVSNKAVTVNFPSAVSSAFYYNPSSGYQTAAEMLTGRGYWLKYSPGIDAMPTSGIPLEQDTVDVEDGWNLIGSIASAVDVLSIESIPAGIVTSQFFGYNSAYYTSTTIEPGNAYWVKVNQPGQLMLSSAQTMNVLNGIRRIRIIPTSEQPPPPPGDNGISNPRYPLPNQFALAQNYPNPFNPVTQIRYELPDAGYVTLKIYNVLGQEVETLVSEVQEAGYRSVKWDANRLTSGVYFYRLTAGKYFDVKKMLLLK